ncbi:MAG: TerB family tellurite resistance protein, partial [Chloroflexota bacterium]
GLFIPANEGGGFLSLVWRSLRMERAEATNLLRTFANPKGSRQIIALMKQLAAVDGEIDQSEIDLIAQFTRAWGIEPPKLTPGLVDEVVSLESLDEGLADYLAVEPPPEQAQQLVDLIALLVRADNEVTEREQLVLGELQGQVAAYCAEQLHEDQYAYDVLIVPQSAKQREAVRELLPNAAPEERLGGVVFFVGRYYSQPFAEAVAEKYLALNLYTTWDRVAVNIT